MEPWLMNVLATAGTLVLSLTVTLIFNKIVGIPKELKAREKATLVKEEQHKKDDCARDARIATLETAVNALPGYRAQSLQIQNQLQEVDQQILDTLDNINEGIIANRTALNERLDRLERREKNALRQKILQEHRIFTDDNMNPMRAWTEMEHHSFFELVRDYEELGGNDYVHSEVLPAMNRLRVIPMSDRNALFDLMSSRKL